MLLILCLPLVLAGCATPLPQDITLPKDFKSLKALAEKGDARAQSQLGEKYLRGNGVPKDDKEALKWCRKAADQGDAKGQVILGYMHDMGRGMPENEEEAYVWFRKAAEQGDATAQSNVGIMYYNGRGVREDYVAGYAWLNIAAANGEEVAGEAKNFYKSIRPMTPDQITKAEALVKEMIKKNPKLLKKK